MERQIPLTEGELWRKKRRRQNRSLAIAVCAAVVIGVGAWQIVAATTGPSAVTGPPSCGTGLVIEYGQCVGVTDGTHVFNPSLALVEGKIARENASVRRSGDFVTVALLTPLVTGPGSDVTEQRILQQLEGAYTAQDYLNNQEGYLPRIQLLLANEGSEQQAWPDIVRSLQAEPASVHLVAVVGVGLSLTPTVQAARALASGPDPIPMIGTVDSADGLNSDGPPASLVGTSLSGPIAGLIRVEPTTGDEVALLQAYLGSTLRRAMLVYDTNPQDLYTGTLADDFRARFGGIIIGSEQYAGAPGSTAIANEFSVIAGEVCPAGTLNPPAVLYAGRESLLPLFISQLRGLTMCPGRDITVITGADAEALPASVTGPNSAGPRITVVYPDLTDPGDVSSWYRATFTGAFGDSDLNQSWAIMTYDGVAAAEQAARAVAGESGALLPTRSELRTALFDFNVPTHALQGATGEFLITSDGDERCQGLPVITYKNGGTSVRPPAPQPGCP